MYLQGHDSPSALYCGPPPRNIFYGGSSAAERRQSLGRLDPDKDLHGFTNQVSLIAGIGGFHRALIELIIDGDRDPHVGFDGASELM